MSLYDDLGVAANAAADTIRAAHRRMVKKHHPDKGGDRESFDKVQRAYLILRDPKTRQRYDETGESEVAPDNELGEIAAMIVAAFDGATGECGGQFDTVDLIASMRNHLSARLQNAKANMENLKAGETAINKIMKRLSYKGEKSDLIAGMLNNRLRDSKAAQGAVSKEIETIERAQEYAKDYGYTFDRVMNPSPFAQAAAQSTGSFFNRTSW